MQCHECHSDDEARNHRVTIHHTIGGDINRTVRTEIIYMTAREWERFIAAVPSSPVEL